MRTAIYHLLVKNPVGQYAGNTVFSSVKTPDGIKCLIDVESRDFDFFEEILENDENIISYSVEMM